MGVANARNWEVETGISVRRGHALSKSLSHRSEISEYTLETVMRMPDILFALATCPVIHEDSECRYFIEITYNRLALGESRSRASGVSIV